VGLFQKYGHPELAVFGLKPAVASLVLLRAVKQLRQGKAIDLTAQDDDALLKGCECELERVPSSTCADHLGVLAWFYAGRQVPVQQLVWPSLKREFPCHGDAAACTGTAG